jgi:F-type H+-transporting ATPase subunit gamma
MHTIEDLKRQIESTEGFQSVVKTMKALAAVKIRQYQKAVASLQDYNNTVEMGLRVVLRNSEGFHIAARRGPKDRLGAIVFGSDQGMCGQLNDQVVMHAIAVMNGFSHITREARFILAVGERVADRLRDEGEMVQNVLSVPSSVAGISTKVQDILMDIEQWGAEQDIHRVVLFYSKHLSGASYESRTLHLLPVDHAWLKKLRERPWPSRALPIFTMDWDPLFSILIRHYLFVSLFRALAESLASENTSRLAAMQGAEKSIEERLAELTLDFYQKRQMSITEELLDIVSGFEALEQDERWSV